MRAAPTHHRPLRSRPRPGVWRLVGLLSLCTAGAAHADLYTVEKNGVITITNQKPSKGGKILHRVRDKAQPASGAKRTGSGRQSLGPTDRAARFLPTVQRAAAHYGVPEALIWAVMKIESNFYPEVVSNKGAQGLMQLMPGTAKDLNVHDPFDPTQNIFGGTRYLRMLANRFGGDLVKTLSAYHAGGGAVSSAGGIPYEQTAEYVRLVLNAYYAYQKAPPAAAPQP